MQFDIVIMVYNCSKTIPDTLDSLICQTDSDFSVIIVDDGSTENLYSTISDYNDKLTIRYVRNEKNLGVTMARQRGIDEVTADYFAFLDADDILFPNAIEVWKKEIEKSKPDVIITPFIYTGRYFTMTQHPAAMVACHGKVYSIEFLKKYDIREHENVKCVEDVYLNWQALDLAEKVSILTDIIYVQISTKGSVTTTKEWITNRWKDLTIAKELAVQHISRFKDEPLSNYVMIESRLKTMLRNEAENHEGIIDEIWGRKLYERSTPIQTTQFRQNSENSKS